MFSFGEIIYSRFHQNTKIDFVAMLIHAYQSYQVGSMLVHWFRSVKVKLVYHTKDFKVFYSSRVG